VGPRGTKSDGESLRGPIRTEGRGISTRGGAPVASASRCTTIADACERFRSPPPYALDSRRSNPPLGPGGSARRSPGMSGPSQGPEEWLLHAVVGQRFRRSALATPRVGNPLTDETPCGGGQLMRLERRASTVLRVPIATVVHASKVLMDDRAGTSPDAGSAFLLGFIRRRGLWPSR